MNFVSLVTSSVESEFEMRSMEVNELMPYKCKVEWSSGAVN